MGLCAVIPRRARLRPRWCVLSERARGMDGGSGVRQSGRRGGDVPPARGRSDPGQPVARLPDASSRDRGPPRLLVISLQISATGSGARRSTASAPRASSSPGLRSGATSSRTRDRASRTRGGTSTTTSCAPTRPTYHGFERYGPLHQPHRDDPRSTRAASRRRTSDDAATPSSAPGSTALAWPRPDRTLASGRSAGHFAPSRWRARTVAIDELPRQLPRSTSRASSRAHPGMVWHPNWTSITRSAGDALGWSALCTSLRAERDARSRARSFVRCIAAARRAAGRGAVAHRFRAHLTGRGRRRRGDHHALSAPRVESTRLRSAVLLVAGRSATPATTAGRPLLSPGPTTRSRRRNMRARMPR